MRYKNTLSLSLLSVLLSLAVAYAQAQQTSSRHFQLGPVQQVQPAIEDSHNSPVRPPLSFTFGTIDYPNAPDTWASAINDHNEIVGWYGGNVPDGFLGLGEYGFLLKGRSFKRIVYPQAVNTAAVGLSPSGEIVGYYSFDKYNKSGHGFTLVGNKFTTVDYPGGPIYTLLQSINKSGQILGYCRFTGEGPKGFLLIGGVFTDIVYPGAVYTEPQGMNNAGEVVGYYSTDNATYHGFTFSSGVYTNVDYPGATDTFLYAINNQGQIVGSEDQHAFLLQKATFTAFDVPYSGVAVGGTWPMAINDKGRIVGIYWDASWNYGFGFEATIGK
jgi:probable HAF family extracellular repeat protein